MKSKNNYLIYLNCEENLQFRYMGCSSSNFNQFLKENCDAYFEANGIKKYYNSTKKYNIVTMNFLTGSTELPTVIYAENINEFVINGSDEFAEQTCQFKINTTIKNIPTRFYNNQFYFTKDCTIENCKCSGITFNFYKAPTLISSTFKSCQFYFNGCLTLQQLTVYQELLLTDITNSICP